LNSSYPKDLIFDQGKPFFDYVSAYITAISGLVSVADPANLMQFRLRDVVTIEGKVVPVLSVSPLSVHKQFISGKISAQNVATSLTCMLLNTAYESVKHLNDKSPEFEFFRHTRHAASHGNRFRFLHGEPKRLAHWRNVCIDHMRREQSNPLHDQVCVGNVISSADAVLLLWDIEQQLINSEGVVGDNYDDRRSK
jgi:hypothetical protein